MVYARALRGQLPHARLAHIDTSQASKCPACCVLTAKDVPGENNYGLITSTKPVFATTRCVTGDACPGGGETPEQVDEALEKIVYELEPLPVVDDPVEAMQPDTPVLHERLRQEYPETPNLLKHHKVRKGDIESGFAQADVIIEDDYSVPFIEHAYMEIESSIAVPEKMAALPSTAAARAHRRPPPDRSPGVDETGQRGAYVHGRRVWRQGGYRRADPRRAGRTHYGTGGQGALGPG
jgi:CO/xanthine dehydrogenase Mo-binding subunit